MSYKKTTDRLFCRQPSHRTEDAGFQPEWVEHYRTGICQLSDCIERQDYVYQAETGTIYLCRPWPGVAVWANDVSMNVLPCRPSATDYPFVKLNYCVSGRCEVLLENEKYVYLSEGSLSIDSNQPKEMYRYPTGCYEGLEIVWNLEELFRHPVAILEELGMGAEQLQKMLQRNLGSMIMGVSSKWDELARELIRLLKTAGGRIEDYRFLSLQLLYLLQAGHTRPVKHAYASKGQRRLVNEVKNQIDQNPQYRYTVEQLAAQAGVSPASLKKYFSLVYGCPISEYIREKRIERACVLLRETDLGVGEIAGQTGYAHQGKFSGVFKKYTGQTPLEYKRRYRVIKEGALDDDKII